MAKRGRKSAADKAAEAEREREQLEAVPAVLPSRPEPPASFDENSKARWRAIVNQLAVDYFRPSDLELLEQMIKSENYARHAEAMIATDGQVITNRFGDLVAHPAVKIRDSHLANAIKCARALRLPPSMRMRQDAGKLKDQKPGKAAKPWER